MRNRVLILMAILAAFLFMTQLPCFAEETVKETGVEWRHTHTYTDVDTDTDTVGVDDDGREPFDYGAYLDLEYEINDLVDVGLKNSYEFQKKEFVTMAGVTLKFGGKKE